MFAPPPPGAVLCRACCAIDKSPTEPERTDGAKGQSDDDQVDTFVGTSFPDNPKSALLDRARVPTGQIPLEWGERLFRNGEGMSKLELKVYK